MEVDPVTGMQHRYDLATLREGVDRIEIPHTQFLNDKARNIAEMLRNDPKCHERFGIYWFVIKELLVNRAYDSDAWWRFNSRNDYIYELTDRGDELLSILQGLYYFEENWSATASQYYYRDGVAWHYSVTDEDFLNSGAGVELPS
jgi:hypothetical protein